jgi:hypothetical protein
MLTYLHLIKGIIYIFSNISTFKRAMRFLINSISFSFSFNCRKRDKTYSSFEIELGLECFFLCLVRLNFSVKHLSQQLHLKGLINDVICLRLLLIYG